ncbi:phenylalanine--tRNA ligase subunit beta [Corynebacterium pseudodiphtheriticum]|uniref:phenylalanine--tRNA ligase subunit beta n=1 Tax=Corynebacterium pseudodiphtheriticum TaxID=37637 RepID=UPI00201C1744|nr:phenylalanine--tRNA ligase subunit beta [Corynebacterium pseudodiphtheriticum]UQV59079.1 phenylalanine--tRNA ligase subunit beta [Corynebacterium pseudodiphtheriticum]
MLITQNWVSRLLNQHNPEWAVSPADFDGGYVRVGFETEGYEAIEETTGPLVFGRVEEIEELTEFKKPIRYCQVNVGKANGTGDLQEIICGARNFAEGDLVVIALPGTVLPGGFAIGERKTYGKMSRGMICSVAELGLTDKSDGILTLPAEAGEPGENARGYLGLDDVIFDVNITPDRGYALSARGLSREIASAFGLKYVDPAVDPTVAGLSTEGVPAADGETLSVTIAEDTKTRRFGLRKVTGIDPKAQSPWWMQRELMLSGQRPVNAATDITNYLMLLLGQPMHAFDASKIQGGLTVRCAEEGEKFETLDHVDRALNAEDVVICDESGIQSLAGVMGGTTSEINDETTDVYFEAANWDPITVARTSRRHKLSSEASRRFERGVDPALVEISLDLACALLAEIAGGTVEATRSVQGEVPAAPEIAMDINFPSRIAGVDYPERAVIGRLEEIGAEVSQDGAQLRVTPPTWRSDLTVAVDLVEEVLRLEGLEDIPTILPTPSAGRGLSPAQKRRRAVGHALAYSGYAEILPTPFIANDTFDTWGLAADDSRRNTVAVQNPLESDHAVLGTTLLPSMLDAVRRNVARGRDSVGLFGLQQVSFAVADHTPMPSVAARPDDATVASVINSLPRQPLHVATVGSGELEFTGPWGSGRHYTYADAIESARIVARACGVELEIANAEYLPWHPGRCAQLSVAGTVVGHAGELHPQVVEALGLPARTCAMELNLSALPLDESFPAPRLSAFPALHQDLALVVDDEVPAETVRRVVESAAGDLLESVELFDVFRGEQLGAGKKSLAFNLVFRADDRTLTDDEVNEYRVQAAEKARVELGAHMRA